MRGDPRYDCQTWVLAALRMLREDYIILPTATEENIRRELKDELERSETGTGDTVEERLFP